MTTSIPVDIQEFVSFLNDKPWHIELGQKISGFLGRKDYSPQTIDELLMTTTKLVEQKFVDIVTKNTGDIPEKERFGQGLIALALDRSFLPKGSALHSLLVWFMKMPRNTSHHQFTDFPFLTLVTFITTANFALNEIEQHSPGQEVVGRSLWYHYDPQKERLRLSISNLQKEGCDFADAKVEACLIHSTGQIQTIELKTPRQGMWELDYDTQYDPPGTSRVLLRCYTGSKDRFRIQCDLTYVRFQHAQGTK